MRWHQKKVEEVVEDLGSSLRGLSPEEAQKRLGQYGPNELEEKKKKTSFMMLLDQFKDFMIIVLILPLATGRIWHIREPCHWFS